MEFPQVFRSEDRDDERAAGAELAAVVSNLGIEEPFVVSSRHAAELTRELAAGRNVERVDAGADQSWAAALGSRAKRGGADAIVAAGGGRTLDVGKLAAARAGLGIVSVPTQLSHDGICSPVAVVPDAEGRNESVGAIPPRAVFISLPTLLKAPTPSVAAGIGDLLANPLALRDWALAARHGLEEIDRRAWNISAAAYADIEPYLELGIEALSGDASFIDGLADALIRSGTAMIVAGTSRPASGGEHEISHALEEIYGGRALHGAQVAFGCIVSLALYDEDTTGFRARLRSLQLPEHPSDLGLSRAEMVRVLLEAPNTRPGRFTILEEADLDVPSAGALVDRVWG